MKKFLYSAKMLYILAALLVLVFFLPDLIGPVPAIICGGAVIAFAYYVYNLWCRQGDAAAASEDMDTIDSDGFTPDIGQTGKAANHKTEKTMFLDLLRKRRSIRQFTDQKVEQEKLDMLLEAVLRSPSSRGLNPWEFVVVTEQDTIAKLAKAKTHGSAFLARAPLAIVVCADPAKSDVWVEDASIASLILHLCSTDLGLGSCWIQIRKREHDEGKSAEAYVRETLGLKAGLAVEALIAVGYPAEEKPGRGESSLLFDRISYETYGKTQRQ